VICLRRRSWAHIQPRDEDEIWAGEVTSVTRDGRVARYRPAGRFGWEPPGSTTAIRGERLPGPEQLQHTWLVSARKADVPGALATAACRTWPGQDDQARPFDTLAQAMTALQPHVPGRPGHEQLRDAARAWEAARKAAYPLLTPAVQAIGSPDFTPLSRAYHEAVAAANSAYRHQYARVTGHEIEAS
jgi:hypothetical protein